MRIEVNLENILEYSLDTITGNSREDLLTRAAYEMQVNGNVMHVVIPDVMGGDTEAPTERNVFEHHADMPEPDGYVHEQQSVDLASACSYKMEYDTGKSYFVCQKHNALSKHSVDALSHAPCLAIDPYPED